ncbi:DUF2339 domain-containing protein [Rhizobium wuzhouense]|uniref:DUF2339 domain-containing protein n=1 Tax=Rhizobium wuzhouense TaxID=1986026 RepID=UPI0014027331|nr:DUF2339 domain-containing protein [Rhizobium wuzhouense]
MFELLLLILIGVLFFMQRGSADRMDRLENELRSVREKLLRLGQPSPSMRAASETQKLDEAAAAPMEPAPPTPAWGKVEALEAKIEERNNAQLLAQPVPDTPEEGGSPAEPNYLADATIPTGSSIAANPPEAAKPTETVVPRISDKAAPPSENLENLLGARWAVWAGGLALALGGVFLVRYSIESGLLGPGVRLTLAALFGLALIATGELIRRKALPKAEALYSNAMVPGILTAAGAVTLFGAIYAAHGVYDYIGPTLAFILLSLTAFGVLGLSLLHGQTLAGLGLAGSMVTPLLISTTSPNLWTLFIYLTVAQVTTSMAARLKGWLIVPALAQALLGVWALVALIDLNDITPVALSLMAMIAAWMLIWPGATGDDPADPDAPLSLESLGRRMESGQIGLDVTLSLAVMLPAIAMLNRNLTDLFPLFGFAALITALAAAGSARFGTFWPTAIASAGALLGATIATGMIGQAQTLVFGWESDATSLPPIDINVMYLLLGLAVVFLLIGLAQIRRRFADDPLFSTVWAIIAAMLPIALTTISFVFYGVYARDWLHAFFAIALGAVLLAACEIFERKGALPRFRRGVDVLLTGSFAAFALALHTLTDGVVTTILLALLGFAYLMATRKRSWSGLPWILVISLAGVLFRIGWDPTLVGPDALWRTPVFNQLLPGYGIPALLAVYGAYEMRSWPGARVRNALQGLASLLGLLTVAILVRHAMNGGVLDSTVPTLGEQSIYTLLVVGLSGILMTLDLKSPSVAFRLGSMVAGGLAVLQTVSLHLGALNPYFSGESTGSWPFINLLLIGYLLPASGYGGLAYYARDKRPRPYVMLLALSSAALAFAWVTLTVRRYWQGEFISYWKGFGQAEIYSYPVAWLAIGVALLVVGSRFEARHQRPWLGLPWISVASLAGILILIGWDPTLVGAEALWRTPVFNQLLPGYGIPALLAIYGAYEMRNWSDLRARYALQGFASLLSLLTVAVLIRHAMNGGVLDSSTPTLGEQSIYTLLVIGLSGILMTLDLKSPSPVFRYGSMVAGGVAIAQTVSLHLGALNPYFSGEGTGSWPFLNLLLIGYLLPGIAYAGLAFYARNKRPLPYVVLLALSGAVLGFAWVTLSVRRFWQGEYIAYWKGFEQAETYSYSVAWLAIGVGLLALGSRFDARSLRIASAVIVIVTVAKVFLVDMANLEGVLRALSFIGLGFVLIGIGLFYQKILSSKTKPAPAVEPEEEPTGI